MAASAGAGIQLMGVIMLTITLRSAGLAMFVALTACNADSTANILDPLNLAETEMRAWSQWSPPLDVGPLVNASGSEISPAFSPDGLSLYFSSQRTGGFGSFDIYVATRSSTCGSFGAPVNLGSVINSSEREQGAFVSHDGHWLFFMRGNAGLTEGDIYVAWRADTHDDFAWERPVALGSAVNTAQLETEPWFVRAGSNDDVFGWLYFGRGPNNNSQDFYAAEVATDGRTRGAAILVAELSSAGVAPLGNEDGITISKNGKEALFASRRFATGAAELFVSSRAGVDAAWGQPQRVAELNSARPDLHPALSDDGSSVVFSSARDGRFRIYLATRTPSGTNRQSCGIPR